MVIEEQEVFCPNFPKDRCRVAMFNKRTLSFDPGAQLKVSMYWCKYNKFYVISNYMRVTLEPYPYLDFHESYMVSFV